MKYPLVSILIITMNHEKYIEQACISAIKQSYKNIEIIFLDNLSDDNTAIIGEKTIKNSTISFKILKHQSRFGIAKNLNLMIDNASGKYIGILSGDDWWCENLIAEKVKLAEDQNFDYILSDGYKFIEETSEIKDAYTYNEKKNLLRNLDYFFLENVTGNKTLNVGTFVKTRVLREHPFDENINTEDWDMNLRLAFLGYKIGFVDEKLFYYRVLKRSLSRNWVIMQDSYLKVTSKYLDFIKSNKDLEREYNLNLLKFKFEILLENSKNNIERKSLLKEWKKEKYKIKYNQPLLSIKLFINKYCN